MSSSGRGAGGCLGALFGLLLIDLLMKMVLFPLFGMNTKTSWQLYSKVLIVIIIGAVVATVIVEIIVTSKNEKDKDSTKDDKANDKMKTNNDGSVDIENKVKQK